MCQDPTLVKARKNKKSTVAVLNSKGRRIICNYGAFKSAKILEGSVETIQTLSQSVTPYAQHLLRTSETKKNPD